METVGQVRSQLKIDAFEYVVYKLIRWDMSINDIHDYKIYNTFNDLSKLKIIKLHFFVSAIQSHKNSLLHVFNNFYAMPYGHVESDVYNNLGNLKFFLIDSRKLTIKDPDNFGIELFSEIVPESIRIDIDNAVSALKHKNVQLITYNSINLVELSHKWESWQSMYNYALKGSRYSESIPVDFIKEEDKLFSLE